LLAGYGGRDKPAAGKLMDFVDQGLAPKTPGLSRADLTGTRWNSDKRLPATPAHDKR